MISTISNIIDEINNLLWGKATLILIFASGIFLTVRCGFIQLIHPIRILKKTLLSPSEDCSEKSKGGISNLQALSTALGASMGTGNIIGVAAAISVGGCGAVFWMILSAFVVMALAFTENVLGVHYKKRFRSEKNSCGALLYLDKGINSHGMAVLFAVACITASFFTGNMSQVNSAASSLDNFGLPRVIIGAVFALAVAAVIFRGANFIAGVMEKIIPIISIAYIFFSLVVIVLYGNNISEVITNIVKSAFGISQAAGGIMGTIINKSLSVGLRRGIFSNEAGMGSSVFAHTSAKCDDPTAMGMWAILEVFIDTVLCCTLTALVILCTGADEAGLGGADMVIFAFEKGIGKFSAYFIAAANVIFAFAAVIGWYFYGEKCAVYLSPSGKLKTLYRIAYTAAAYAGAVTSTDLIWKQADIFNALMLFPNLAAILILSNEAVPYAKSR